MRTAFPVNLAAARYANMLMFLAARPHAQLSNAPRRLRALKQGIAAEDDDFSIDLSMQTQLAGEETPTFYDSFSMEMLSMHRANFVFLERKSTKSAKSVGDSTCPSSKGGKSGGSGTSSKANKSGDSAKANKSGDSAKANKSSRCPVEPKPTPKPKPKPTPKPTPFPTLAPTPQPGCIASTCDLYNTTADFPCGDTCGDPICTTIAENGTIDTAIDGPGLCINNDPCASLFQCNLLAFNVTGCPLDLPCIIDSCCTPFCVLPPQAQLPPFLCNATDDIEADLDLVELVNGLIESGQLEALSEGGYIASVV